MNYLSAMPIPVDSSLLASVAYDATAAVLQLELRSGSNYRYFGVPRTTYEALLAADSKGTYFNGFIRERFSYALVKR